MPYAPQERADRPPAPSGRPAPARARPDPHQLIQLQRQAGNRATVARVQQAQATVQRDGPGGPPGPTPPGPTTPGTAAAGLDQTSAAALITAGLVLDDGDRGLLVQGFPQGFTVGPPQPVILGMQFGTRLDGFRTNAFRLTTVAPAVGQGVEAWIFQPGKGRAILVSSIGGGSVLMDAGAGQTSSITAPSVLKLANAIGAVATGVTGVPERIILSHADTDHYNAARALMTNAGFAATTIQVAMEQVRGAGAGAWSTMSLTAQPTQRVLEINVTGGGGSVHVNRIVIGNMELTEYRSVAAHQNLMDASRTTYNRNHTSPVTVVRDLVNGQRMLFTADANGRQFDEIVNAVGDSGLRLILGSEGHNLKLMEAPHHFGEQSGPDARGMINMLQLAYESGNGDLRLVGQTTTNFAAKPSSTYNFLDTAGVSPEKIEGDPSPAGQAQAVRARGSALARVTVDMQGAQTAISALQANDTPLRDAYRKLAAISNMLSETAALRASLSGGDAPAAMLSSLTATETDLQNRQTQLRTATDTIWNEMRTAEAGVGGVRTSADMTQVTAALQQLAATLPEHDTQLTQAANDLVAHGQGLSLYSRLSYNSVRIIQAMQADNVEELFKARAETNDLWRAAKGVLGTAVVHEHVKSAWAATQAEWTPEKFEARTAEMSAMVAQREMSAEFRTVLSETLARQIELNEVVARAETSGRAIYAPGGQIVTPTSTRVGAAGLAAIEVVRIGLDCISQYRAGAAAAEARRARSARTGMAAMNWWLRLGITPQIALAKMSSWDNTEANIVFDGDQATAMKAALSEQEIPGVPDFTAAVVTGVPGDDLRHLVHRAVAELSNLQDWTRFVTGYPAGPLLENFGINWGVRLWSREDKKYGYIDVDGLSPGLGLELTRLYEQLKKGQQVTFDDQAAAAGANGVKSVKDTAWFFGADRRVDVYTAGGSPRRIDFDDDKPRFLKEEETSYPVRLDGPLIKVKAVDVPTYERLSSYYWVHQEGEVADEGGNHPNLVVTPNVEGYAYVRPGQLIDAD
ncbi:hypothetical protein SAMN04515671_1076 [Nakamurella panacisegetis]|uniref:Metallo-beta-lactamase superfamily protein n=1 Tax=Nakamurella panacisegetis TaxID=1090615 RepID=A0A1H0JWV6_9ACTN|nr:hypothetical protein [Nakamurella panacisegetis]SDO48100.1 hypothetical protein SAMN04515671_1076 [Nakamurella panacisegetis]